MYQLYMSHFFLVVKVLICEARQTITRLQTNFKEIISVGVRARDSFVKGWDENRDSSVVVGNSSDVYSDSAQQLSPDFRFTAVLRRYSSEKAINVRNVRDSPCRQIYAPPDSIVVFTVLSGPQFALMIVLFSFR